MVLGFAFCALTRKAKRPGMAARSIRGRAVNWVPWSKGFEESFLAVSLE
jgi:hypothetical protein